MFAHSGRMFRRASDSSTGSIAVNVGAPRTLHPGIGSLIVVTAGAVWLTQTGSAADTVLELGESFQVTHEEVLLSTFSTTRPWDMAEASQDARVLVIAPSHASAASPLGAVLRGVGATYLWVMRHLGGTARHRAGLPY